MAASHTGEDAHVRTLQAMFRRAGLSQSLLACGSEGAPQDAIDGRATGARRRGARPDPPHVLRLPHREPAAVAPLSGWSLADYWRPEHPSQVAVRERSRALRRRARRTCVTSVDDCGVLTYAFPLADIARAFALLADPQPARTPYAGQR